MCKDGKCQERAAQARNAVISLGIAARDVSRIVDHPQMVVKVPTHISIATADPELSTVPGVTVMMEVYPTTDDAEIARKADRYLIEATRRKPVLIQMLEQRLGLTSALEVSDGSVDEASRSAPQASAQTA